jgi:hypothetical protein
MNCLKSPQTTLPTAPCPSHDLRYLVSPQRTSISIRFVERNLNPTIHHLGTLFRRSIKPQAPHPPTTLLIITPHLIRSLVSIKVFLLHHDSITKAGQTLTSAIAREDASRSSSRARRVLTTKHHHGRFREAAGSETRYAGMTRTYQFTQLIKT